MGKKNSSANYIGLGLVFGAGLGVTLGAAFGNVGLGISFGAGIGLVIGTIIFSLSQTTKPKDDA